ncbi:MAG: class I SAM-dependent methyltransferase [Bacillota bacterium]|nr:class I SAM-dependent methyltransferase [Bacillota bacterium]
MIKLSERLRIIADRMDNCKTMADIGTDHGFLPAYMIESGRCERAVAADISQPSLEKARQLCEERGITACEMRVGDGLDVLEPGEVEGVVIAGMGGTLIAEILDGGRSVSESLKRIVMQPRTASGELRKWLMDNGYRIVAEDVVYEGKFVPQIITAVPPGRPLDGMEDLSAAGVSGDGELYYEIPRWIIRGGGPIGEHVRRVMRRERNTLEGLMSAKIKDEARIREKQTEIKYLAELLESCEP